MSGNSGESALQTAPIVIDRVVARRASAAVVSGIALM
jgi:hypothetical protein